MSSSHRSSRLKVGREWVATAAPLHDLAYDLFDRLDEEVRRAEAATAADPVARARALSRNRAQIATDSTTRNK